MRKAGVSSSLFGPCCHPCQRNQQHIWTIYSLCQPSAGRGTMTIFLEKAESCSPTHLRAHVGSGTAASRSSFLRIRCRNLVTTQSCLCSVQFRSAVRQAEAENGLLFREGHSASCKQSCGVRFLECHCHPRTVEFQIQWQRPKLV